MKRLLRLLIACLLSSSVLLAPGQALAATTTHVYVAPDGDDAAAGTRAEPFATLRQANAHLEAGRPDTPVHVHLAAGTYAETGTRWTYASSHPLIIAADQGVATFTGNEAFADYLIKINPTVPGTTMNLRMANLRFTAATNGLQLKNLRNAVLTDMTFDHLGTHYSPVGTGYAALSIQQVSGVSVHRPTFTNLVNSPDQLALVHAVYAANDADDVTITDVSINRVSGDPLRFRNGSDRFHITGGVVRNAGEFTAFSEWFDPTRDEARSLDARLVDVSVSSRGFDSPLQIGRTACFQRFTLEPVDPCYITDLP